MMLSRWQLERVARILKEGGVIAYPTESVYGLGCNPNDDNALRRLLAIKKRDPAKGLIILFSDLEQATPYLEPLSHAQKAQICTPQPRATSLLIKCKPSLSPLLRGQFDSIAVRVTGHPQAKAIIDYTDQPLVSTSCNLAGKPEMKQTSQVRSRMSQSVDLIIAGRCGGENPSRIIDLASGRVIRQ